MSASDVYSINSAQSDSEDVEPLMEHDAGVFLVVADHFYLIKIFHLLHVKIKYNHVFIVN